MPKPNVFVAKKEGKCPICDKEMFNTRIVLSSKLNKFCHADCVFINHAKSSPQPAKQTDARKQGGVIVNTGAKPINSNPLSRSSETFFKGNEAPAFPAYPTPISEAEIDRMLKESLAKAEELSDGQNLVLANSIFKARFEVKKMNFEIELSTAINARMNKQLQDKLTMVKDVKGRE